MRTALQKSEVIKGFLLKNLKSYDYRELLTSDIPEEILLAILSDYIDESPISVIRLIMKRLQEVSENEI